MKGANPKPGIFFSATPGAKVYVGFRSHVSLNLIEETLAAHEDLHPLMYAYDVAPGDVFVIEPGVPHAIGAGITLIEPQRVVTGCRGVTYRYWDWNRKYDVNGQESPDGNLESSTWNTR